MGNTSIHIKIPYALSLTKRQAHLYAHYIDFKCYNPEGRLTPKEYGRIKRNRVLNKYWLDKLVSAGWAYKDGKAYCMRSFDHVWEVLRISKKPNKKTGRLYTPFYKLNPEKLDFEKKIYIKQIIDHLLERTASNHRRRMLYRKKRTHKLERGLDNFEFFGVRKAAKLFGFKSPITGLKYRNKYFSVLKSERKLRRTSVDEFYKWRILEKRGVEFLYEADKIAL